MYVCLYAYIHTYRNDEANEKPPPFHGGCGRRRGHDLLVYVFAKHGEVYHKADGTTMYDSRKPARMVKEARTFHAENYSMLCSPSEPVGRQSSCPITREL